MLVPSASITFVPTPLQLPAIGSQMDELPTGRRGEGPRRWSETEEVKRKGWGWGGSGGAEEDEGKKGQTGRLTI